MTSWREGLSDAVQSDVERVVEAATDAATHLLRRRGELYPIGVALQMDDEVVAFAADPGFGDHPDSVNVLDALVEGARAGRDSLRAVALASDVTLAEGGDAVRVQVEHREGVALDVVVPYRRRRLPRSLVTGDPSVSPGDVAVWAEGSSGSR